MQEIYDKAGQGHVFANFNKLSEQDKTKLEVQTKGLDVATVNQLFENLIVNHTHTKDIDSNLEKLSDDFVVRHDKMDDKEKSQYWQKGLELIKEGQVAAVVLAGGQGSRLGFEHPKGMFSIGLPSKKSIFQILTERFFRAQMLAHGVDALSPEI